MLSIVLNIDETPTTRPDSITMFGCPEVISGAQNSQIVSTNRITTNDNNNRPALVSYSIVNGLLPTGLILSSDTGIISGTPTINSDGSFQIKAMGVTGSL
jgi:hypothetical protein